MMNPQAVSSKAEMMKGAKAARMPKAKYSTTYSTAPMITAQMASP